MRPRALLLRRLPLAVLGGFCTIGPMADETVPFPENAAFGCVNCGSLNHTTGDRAWCPREKDRDSAQLSGDGEAGEARP